MSILSISEVVESGQGEETTSGLAATRVFHVVTSSPSDTVTSILGDNRTAGGVTIPSVRNLYPNQSMLRCSRVSASRIDDTLWKVVCSYEMGQGGGGSPTRRSGKPWDLPPYNISMACREDEKAAMVAYDKDNESISTYADLDLTGVPVLNSAGDYFDPPIMQYESVFELAFSYNVKASAYKNEWIRKYMGSVNFEQATVIGHVIPAKCGIIRELSASYVDALAESGTSDGDDYYRMDVKIDVYNAPDGAMVRVLDRGYYSLESGKKWQIKTNSSGDIVTSTATAKDSPVTEPQILDNGAVAPIGSPFTADNYLKFLTRPQLKWLELELPKKIATSGTAIGEKFK
jgi:hypothetical protein